MKELLEICGHCNNYKFNSNPKLNGTCKRVSKYCRHTRPPVHRVCEHYNQKNN